MVARRHAAGGARRAVSVAALAPAAAARAPRAFCSCVALAAPLGFIAVEAGWTVTEVGRQPWIIYGVLRTRDALTPMPGLIWPLADDAVRVRGADAGRS